MNIKVRRDYIKGNEKLASTPTSLVQFLPEYAVPYVVHLLAHHPEAQDRNSIIKLCLGDDESGTKGYVQIRTSVTYADA